MNLNVAFTFPDKFQLYDFGLKDNLEKYGTIDPPQYNWTNVKIPSVIFYSNDDWLAPPQVIYLEILFAGNMKNI